MPDDINMDDLSNEDPGKKPEKGAASMKKTTTNEGKYPKKEDKKESIKDSKKEPKVASK